MHHDPKLSTPREPAGSEPARTLCRPPARRGTGAFHGWGPKLG